MKFKRRRLLSSLLGFFTGVGTAATGPVASRASEREIEAKTVEELFRAIGSNRTIKLTAPRYDLSELTAELSWTNANFENDTLTIFGVENLRIVGDRDSKPFVLTPYEYSPVLNFVNCRQIGVEGIEAGHWPKKGICSGAVVHLENCDRVEINHSVLFGSGSIGIRGDRVSNLSCDGITIKECTAHIFAYFNSSGLQVKNSDFYNNEGRYLIYLVRSEEPFQFENCSFFRNNFNRELVSFLVDTIPENTPVQFVDCTIENNNITAISEQPLSLEFINTYIDKTGFEEESP
jgi:hypothetical protein